MFQHITVLFSFAFAIALTHVLSYSAVLYLLAHLNAGRRPVLLSAFAVTYAMSMVANFADRNNLEGWKPGDWIGLTCSFCRC